MVSDPLCLAEKVGQGQRISKCVENAADMFTFIRDAVEKFKNGSFERRRMILVALGQKLLLKDKILSIDLENSLIPTQKLSFEVQEIHERLEPRKSLMKQEDFEQIYSQNPIVSAH